MFIHRVYGRVVPWNPVVCIGRLVMFYTSVVDRGFRGAFERNGFEERGDFAGIIVEP
jgi:hypothetical protein